MINYASWISFLTMNRECHLSVFIASGTLLSLLRNVEYKYYTIIDPAVDEIYDLP